MLKKKAKKKNDTSNVAKPKFREFQEIPKYERADFSVFDVEKDLVFNDNQIDTVNNKQLLVKRCGSIDKFDQYSIAYQKSKANFMEVSYGITKKIIYGKNTFIFSGNKGEPRPKGMHLIGMVKRDIDNLITQSYNPVIDEYEIWDKIPKIPQKKPHLTSVNYRNCHWFGTGVQMLAIDINHCYWRTAFMLGYITEDTYLKGIERDDFKKARLISIGTLGKMLTVKMYEDGTKTKEYIDDRDYLKYGRFFWHIISKIYELLQELISELKDDFLMYLTDCVFIDETKRDVVMSIMSKHGYAAKEYFATFTNVDNNKLNWITDKGEEKQMVVVDYYKKEFSVVG
jgi:hypothetical protein